MKTRLRKSYRRILPAVIASIVIIICTACGKENNEPKITATVLGAGHINDNWKNLVQNLNAQLFEEWAQLTTLEETYGRMYIEQIDELDGITMKVSSVTAEGATIVCTNSTDKEIVFGDDYELQLWKDGERENGVWKQGEWHQVKYTIDDAAFDAIGYSLLPDMSLDWDVNWTYFHGTLPAGHYRITKSALDVCETGDVIKYNLAAEFDVLSDEKSKELNAENEKAFYKKAESFGLDKTKAESYFRMICNDKVIQNDVAEFRGFVMDDFDQNGQEDIAIMVKAYNSHCYGTGYVYFYMNGDNPYRFYDEDFAFGRDLYVFGTDLDNDGYTELVFGAAGTGCGGSGDWYNRILKYKNNSLEKMEIPTEETQGFIDVVITKDEKENTYISYCEYLDDEIVFETYNPDIEEYGGVGSNYRGFYDVQCVAYEDRYAIQASVYLYGCGHSDCVGEAKFLIVWDEDGSSHFEKWWIEPHYHERG